jgi:hypothetical protein
MFITYSVIQKWDTIVELTDGNSNVTWNANIGWFDLGFYGFNNWLNHRLNHWLNHLLNHRLNHWLNHWLNHLLNHLLNHYTTLGVLFCETVFVKVALALCVEVAWAAGVQVHFISYIYTKIL